MGKAFPENGVADCQIPYYYQIASLLRRKIELGDIQPGSKLPNEMDLAKSFGVSCVPIRHALALLAADGLVLRERGRGTFVAESAKRLKTYKLTGIVESGPISGGGYRLLSMEKVPITPQLMDFFALGRDAHLMRVHRLALMGKKPISYLMHYLPVEIAERMDCANLQKLSMLDILKSDLGIRLGKVLQTIEARVADSTIATELSIEVMAPALCVETFVRDKSGKPVEFSQIFYRGNRYKYLVELIPHDDDTRAGDQPPGSSVQTEGVELSG